MMGKLYEDLWLSGRFEAERINQHSQQRLLRDCSDAFTSLEISLKGLTLGFDLTEIIVVADDTS